MLRRSHGNQVLLLSAVAAVITLVACSSDNHSADGGLPDGSTDASVDGGTDAGVDAGGKYSMWDYSTRWIPNIVPACPSPPNPTAKNLKEKAQYYDWFASRLHLVPESVRPYTLVHDVVLDADAPAAIVPDKQLPNVVLYEFGENHGLWSSLFVASQAFKYAVTKDKETLGILKRSFTGLYNAMKITGVPGLFTREYRDPALPGDTCYEDGPEYAKPVDKVGNRWVKLDGDACTWYWDPAADGGKGKMVKDEPAHCVDKKFAGMCWQRNCSKDESSGHNFVAAIVYKLVDDPELKEMAREVLVGLADHLVNNAYWLKDYDGTPTRYGSYNALSMDEIPGFNAICAVAATRSGLVAGNGVKNLSDAYYNCLLQEKGRRQCIKQPVEYENPRDYREYMDEGLGISLGCAIENYDNVNMALLNYFLLVSFEGETELRQEYRRFF